MQSLERIGGLIAGDPVDHLPVQPLIMQLAAPENLRALVAYARDHGPEDLPSMDG